MTRPRRIALVVPSLRGGGLERVVRDLALDLQRLGDQPALFAIDGLGLHAEALLARGIGVHDCQESRWRVRGIPARLIRALRIFQPDVLHAHSGTWYPSAVARIAIGWRKPLVYTEHGRYPPESWRRALVERQLGRITNQIVAVSDTVADYLSEFLSLAIRPMVIPNGIDLAPFREPRPAARAALRKAWNIDDEAVVVAAVGRFVPVKNHAAILRGFAAATRQVPSLRLVLLGSGPLEAGLRALATQLGIAPGVIFAGYREDVPDCLAAADCWVCTSATEGLPIAFLEAMAAGLAIVSYEVGGIPAALGNAGLLVPQGNEEELTNALVSFGRDARKRHECQQSAKTRATSYSLGVMTNRYQSVYRASMVPSMGT